MEAHKVVGGINHLVNALIILLFIPFLLFGSYALYDNALIKRDVQSYDTYKPDHHMSFESLQKRNPDVFGWITIAHSAIDQPLVQGQDNTHYINTNVLGEFSLAGSIFLDQRNHKDLRETNNILYGHNIEDQEMFGDLKKFAHKDYFNSHQQGKIYYQKAWHPLHIIAYVHTNAYDQSFYTPSVTPLQFLDNVKRKAIYKRDLTSANTHFLTLSTCSNADTDGRELLITTIGGHS